MIPLPRIPDRWQQYEVVIRDLPLALLLLVAALVPGLHLGTQVGNIPTRPFDVLAVAVVALECLPLAVRQPWPTASLVLSSLGFAVDQLRGYHTAGGTALAFIILSAGVHLERFRRTVIVLLSAAYGLWAIAVDRLGTANDATDRVTEFLTFYLVLAILWGIGARMRLSRQAEAERRRHVAETSRAAERTRIAGELHDVVTHHVTAMVVQAESARYLTASPERLDETLTAVTDTGRRAIADLRHLLEVLDPDHGTTAPALTVGELRSLVEQTRRAGQPVEFTEEGDPQDVAGSAELAAYRVVQEALTNALKYAHGSRTVVHVQHRTREIIVDVSTAGSRSQSASPGGSGRGLAGLRERVGLLGGEFSAGRGADGSFVVRARIPAGSPA